MTFRIFFGSPHSWRWGSVRITFQELKVMSGACISLPELPLATATSDVIRWSWVVLTHDAADTYSVLGVA